MYNVYVVILFVLIQRVSKNMHNYFCYNYAKLLPNVTVFGTKMAKESKIIRGAFIFHLT